MDVVVAEIHNQNRIRFIGASFVDKDQLMTIPGARWDKRDLFVHIPLTFAACKQARAILEERLEIGDELHEWAVNEVTSRVEPCLNLRQATQVLDSSGLCDGLYPFQQAGARFLMTAQHAILADLMGSGKTVQAIAAARAIQEGQKSALPALVICPNSMKRTWKKEIELWWPGIPVHVIEGSKAKKTKTFKEASENPGVVIINWEAVRLHSRLAPYGSLRLSDEERRLKELNQIPFQLVIVDEAHRLKDPQSKQTRAVWAAGQDVPWRWCLTGTPLTNTPETMWPILHFLNKEEHPSKGAFVERYCDSAPSRYGPGLDIFGLNEATKEEFFEIFDPRFRRMPKEVVLPNLPPIQRVRKYVEMSDDQTRAYREMAEEMVTTDEEGNLIIAVNPVSKLTRLIQYSSATLKIEEGVARLSDPSSKLDQLMADLPDYLEAEESIVVFAVHRQLIEMAEERLKTKKIPYAVIKGQQSESVRQKAIDDFQSKKVPVILVVIAAGGIGITLTTGRIAIFLQRSYSFVDMSQAEARIHRIGSEIHDSIMIVDYITNGTVEQWQLDSLEGKAGHLEEVVRDQEAIRKMLGLED